ncbi:MBL fold metallo-hydrolase [Nocardiopsis terrae]|uniref:Cyclase n=1 Tax=Nocardiopsis terrae TaxID=372655 RepID=A0ABR9HJ29_9ACTN|nr:MBL fold metallo-hydrolase [Nocardiopsis terrae]MBE1459027.1 cyclase [Nocardiopsis terrae]GHC87710.1 MBL fold metallo-hydrolase [Nocardiopsis terrae]
MGQTALTGPDAGELSEIVEGVYAWVQPDGTWWVNNAGAVAGDDGLLVVDTCATATRTRRFLDALAAATAGAPLRWAVNTHQHGDHTYGNSLLPGSTALIGHTAMRGALSEDPLLENPPAVWEPVPEWGDVTRRLPSITLDRALTLHLGGRRVDLRHPGYTAHTPGDVVAWLPEERVLFTGDLLFHGLTPLVLTGSVDGALRSLEWVRSFGPEHVVPGHGPLLTGAELDEVLAAHERYYRFVLEAAEGAVREGRPPLECALTADLGEFGGWADAERIVMNLHRARADLVGEPLDPARALSDAVRWNGGPMSTSL